MIKRLLSSIIIVAITIISIMYSSVLFLVFVSVLGLLAIREFLNLKYHEVKISTVRLIAYISVLLLISNNVLYKGTYNVLFALILSVLLLILIIYNKPDKYNITDVLFVYGGILLIGLSFNSLAIIRSTSIFKCIYIFIVCYATDTFAYLGGYLIGRHKLTNISPKKTWEGSIIGSALGTLVASTYFLALINQTNPLIVIIMTLFLTIMDQYGDLIFSSIKRYFNIKDYSNLIPGHGGILDRYDSVIFISLIFTIIEVFI